MNPGIRFGKGSSWIVAGVLLAIFGVFVIPWYIPLYDPVWGLSYSYGFCNTAALLGLGVSLCCITVGRIKNGTPATAFTWFEQRPGLMPPFRQAVPEYLVLIVTSALSATAVLIFNAVLVNPYWGDAGTFLCRIDLVLLGYKPYSDFQFLYGPALLYIPIFLDWLTGGVFGIEAAYAATVALFFVLGFITVFIFLRCLNLSGKSRALVLILTCLVFFYLTLDLEFTPLRYGIVPCTIVIGNMLLTRLSRRWIRFLAAAVTVAVGIYGCFLISPEMGIAGTMGLGASSVVLLWSRQHTKAAACLLGIGIAVSLVVLWNSEFLFGVKSFASGMGNFPIYPTVFNLTLVAAALFILPEIACAIWQAPSHPISPMAAALAAAACTLMAAAMGRCDPYHVIYNEIILFTLLFPALAHLKKHGGWLVRGWTVFYLLTFVILLQVFYWKETSSKLKEAWNLHEWCATHPEEMAESRGQWKKWKELSLNSSRLNWHKVIPFPKIGEGLISPFDRVSTPLGADVSLDRYLKLRNAFHPSYFPNITPEIHNPANVSRVIEESLNSSDVLIVTQSMGIRLDLTSYTDSTCAFMSKTLFYPVHSTVRNYPYLPIREISSSLMSLPLESLLGKCSSLTENYLVIRAKN